MSPEHEDVDLDALEAQLPAAVVAEAKSPLPEDVRGYHDELLRAADEHDVIRMDHLVHGWSTARYELVADTPQEQSMWARLDRRLGQVLLGQQHPAAGQVLAEAVTMAAESGDELEELRGRLAFVAVEAAVGDDTAYNSGLGYVEQLLAMGEYGHAASGLMGLAQMAPDGEAGPLLLRASHLYERDGDGGWAAHAAVLAARVLASVDDPRLESALARARELVEANPTVELRIELVEVEAVVTWHQGDAASATQLLEAAIDAAVRTGRPVPPTLRIMLCDILVETAQWQALEGPARGLVEQGTLVGDDELTSMGERYLALATAG